MLQKQTQAPRFYREKIFQCSKNLIISWTSMPIWLNTGGGDYYEGEEETRKRKKLGRERVGKLRRI